MRRLTKLHPSATLASAGTRNPWTAAHREQQVPGCEPKNHITKYLHILDNMWNSCPWLLERSHAGANTLELH
jgi:hypothetical protein